MNKRNKEVFIIDSNALITPYKFYYSFEIAPQFWDTMVEHIMRKNNVSKSVSIPQDTQDLVLPPDVREQAGVKPGARFGVMALRK
jgi:hypothetical protein